MTSSRWGGGLVKNSQNSDGNGWIQGEKVGGSAKVGSPEL